MWARGLHYPRRLAPHAVGNLAKEKVKNSTECRAFWGQHVGKVFTQPLLPWALRSGQCGWMNSAASVVANAREKQVAIKTMPAMDCRTPRQKQSGYISHTIVGRHVWATLQSGQIATAMSRLPKRKRNKSGYVTSTIFGCPKRGGN